MITKLAKAHFYHATSKDTLHKILGSGKVLRPKDIQGQKSIELIPGITKHFNLPGSLADVASTIRGNVDRIFLTKDGYDPRYGDHVIKKQLASPEEHDKLTLIPNEHTTKRQLKVSKNTQVLVPKEEVHEWTKAYPGVNFAPSDHEHRFTWKDRASRLFNGTVPVPDQPKTRAVASRVLRTVGSKGMLAGSAALGTDIAGGDVDVLLPYKSRRHFEAAKERLSKTFPDLRLGTNRDNKFVLTGKNQGVPVDVVLAHGEQPLAFAEQFKKVKNSLTAEDKAAIIKRKKELKNSWFFPQTRYKRYKRQLAEEQGLKQLYF